LPGGLIDRTDGWLVEHCVGPLPVGTLVVKPARHVIHLADLSPTEAEELGPLLRRSATVVTELCDPDQVYVCLWSHAGGQPGHVHFVCQPAARPARPDPGTYGTSLQVALFDQNRPPAPAPAEVEAFAERARAAFASAE
jgi:diadenosine tetraphosphate (Ap4A) HIT family hydrolase